MDNLEELSRKYQFFLDKYAQEKNYNQESIELLRSVIAKLSIAIDGINPRLDREVAALRREIRNGVNNYTIANYIEGISQIIRSLEVEKQSKQVDIHSVVKTSIKKVIDGQIDNHIKTKLTYFLNKIANYEEKELYFAYLHLLEDFVMLYGEKAKIDPEQSKLSLWQRLISSPNSKDTKSLVLKALYEMLDYISLNERIKFKAYRVKQEINKNFSIEALPSILNKITELINENIALNKEQFEAFVVQVNQRLMELHKHLIQSNMDTESVLKETAALDSRITSEALGLKDNLSKDSSGRDLAHALESGLGKIVQNVRKFHQTEKDRSFERVEKIKLLEERLHQTEKDAEELRVSLSQQRYKALHDPLTGLPNREAYNEKMQEFFERHKRYKTNYALAVCDIDFFKKINDTYGHLAGDKILAKIGGILRETVRKLDFVGRYGGEEFVIILENIDLDKAKEKMEQIRQQVEKCQFHYKKLPVTITISIGLTLLRSDDTKEHLFERADKALYAAKEGGRNRIEVSE